MEMKLKWEKKKKTHTQRRLELMCARPRYVWKHKMKRNKIRTFQLWERIKKKNWKKQQQMQRTHWIKKRRSSQFTRIRVRSEERESEKEMRKKRNPFNSFEASVMIPLFSTFLIEISRSLSLSLSLKTLPLVCGRFTSHVPESNRRIGGLHIEIYISIGRWLIDLSRGVLKSIEIV